MRRKIGIIVQSLNGGGAERAAANLSIDLDENYDVTLIVFDASNITYNYKGRLLDLKITPQIGLIKKIRGLIYKIKKVRNIKRDSSFDYVISFMENANLVNVLSKYKEKVIISERNRISFYNQSFFKKRLIKYLSKQSDKIVALSKGVKQDLIENFNIEEDKIYVIYNSCMKENLETKEKETKDKYKALDTKYRYIMTMGRLHNQKGQWHLMKAFSLVTKEIPNVKLVIIGQGVLESNLRKLSKDLNIEEKVLFTGYMKEPHIFLEKCEIFVFSSIVEGLGNVLLEALNYNKAIISTDCYYGPREILAPNTDIKKQTSQIELAEYGILVPTFKEEKYDESINITEEEKIYADAMIKLLNDKELIKKYENKAIERAKDFYSEKIKEEWNKFFMEKLK